MKYSCLTQHHGWSVPIVSTSLVLAQILLFDPYCGDRAALASGALAGGRESNLRVKPGVEILEDDPRLCFTVHKN